MLEIFLLLMICNKNTYNAISRGRKPTSFVWLTLVLWFIPEFICLTMVSIAGIDRMIGYPLALICGCIGSFISYLITKNCKIGDYVPQDLTWIQKCLKKNIKPISPPMSVENFTTSNTKGGFLAQKILAICNIVSGILISIVPIILGGLSFDPETLIFIAIGIIPIVLGIWFLMAQNSKVKPYPTWMNITNTFTAIISTFPTFIMYLIFCLSWLELI